jgi:cytochrome c
MSDLFFNKIAAAGLAAALGFITINKIAGIAVHADIPSTPDYSKYVAEDTHSAVEVPAPFPQAEWIAGIDPVKGAKVFKKCTSCHNSDEGGKNGTGPALWNIVGRAAATGADFAYSPAMASSGITWNYAELDEYLANPKAYVPKTKMAFIGVKKPADRAAVIEYLRLASNAPVAALTEAAPIPGAETAHDDSEAHEIAAEVETDPMTVETAVEGEAHEAPAEIPVDAEVVPEAVAVEVIEEAATEMADDANDILEAVEEKAEEIVEDVEEATPTPDGGH